jgi:hypothetical protein
VYRNGVKLGTADFTATSGTTVVLASGATAGDLVETVSFYVSSVLNAIPAVANAVTETYINTGAVTQSKLGAGVAGTGPAFSAYKDGSSQNISSGVATKVTFETEVFDTNNNFASSTFTPTVAGYYQINTNITLGGSDTGVAALIYKNGTEEARGWSVPISGVFNACATACKVVYLNGSTDYIEVFAFQSSGSTKAVNTGISQTAVSGALVRAA